MTKLSRTFLFPGLMLALCINVQAQEEPASCDLEGAGDLVACGGPGAGGSPSQRAGRRVTAPAVKWRHGDGDLYRILSVAGSLGHGKDDVGQQCIHGTDQ